MPRYPVLPGICISSARSLTTSFSGVTISSWNVSAIELSSVVLGCRLHLLGSFEYLFDRALHVEGLLRDVVVPARNDVAEALHCIRDFHVASWRAGELL